ncbi:MAG: hypothetical protein K0T99_01380 [Alphaproteobacteria bacterium]|nr:hypothetical protein [Alphaproteobacteria bacterium]
MKEYVPKREGNLFSSVQSYLYDTLCKNKRLSQDLKIYNQVPKDTPYPYIYIGGFSVINRSTKNNSRMYFVNEIHIYAKDHSVEEILHWTNEIKSAMKIRDSYLEDCHIVETEFLQMSLEVMPDSKIYRVINKFRIIVEELDGSI